MTACPLAMLRRRSARAAALTVAMFFTGCTSPPSVMPLLQATERTLAREAEHLGGDGEREAQWLDQTRRALAQAFEADLAQTDELTAAWVLDATRVYVLAREELARHEAQLAAQRRQRTANLSAATEAVRLAGDMLQQQDQLWLDVVDIDLWSLLRPAMAGQTQ
ncbi:MAG: hypothetical protein WD118_07145 [Phycisphaeraceae bacterium]